MQIADGIWPTMVTPFTEENGIDYASLERAMEWYVRKGVNGLFAVCQSSEMFYLDLKERADLARFVKVQSNDRLPVIASGHVSDAFDEQLTELLTLAETGVDAVVLITNRLAKKYESEDRWKSNLEKLLRRIPENVPLGLYECPYPYKRLTSPELLKWCADTGRFKFLKDTCCDVEMIKQRLEAVKGTGLKIFNANSATLLETLKLGVNGYSGIMANFHPEIYVYLMELLSKQPDKADYLSNLLSLASLIETRQYPVNAKYYLMLEGIFENYRCRAVDYSKFTATNRLETEQLHRLSQIISNEYAPGSY